MHPSSQFFLGFFPVVVAVLVVTQFLFQYVYDVGLGAAAVEIVIFKRFVVFSIPYEEIEACASVSRLEVTFILALVLVSRPFGGCVLLRRNRGFIRRIVVTPGRPEEFRAEVIARARRLLT